MFVKLLLEMEKNGITKKQIAKCIDVSYDTVIKKFKGETDWWRSECEKIRDTFFPDIITDELFKQEI